MHVKGRKRIEEYHIFLHNSTTHLFSRANFNKLDADQVTIPETGEYTFAIIFPENADYKVNIFIERIGASNYPELSVEAKYKEVVDTVWQEVSKEVITYDTVAQVLNESVNKVHSKTKIMGHYRSFIELAIPENTFSMSYFISTRTKADEEFRAVELSLMKNGWASFAKIPGYGPLIAFALYGANYINTLEGEESITYQLTYNSQDVQNFMKGDEYKGFKFGSVSQEAYRFDKPQAGNLFILLHNSNIAKGLDVTFKCVALVSKPHKTYIKEKVPVISKHKELDLSEFED